jgi:hypothetical protein
VANVHASNSQAVRIIAGHVVEMTDLILIDDLVSDLSGDGAQTGWNRGEVDRRCWLVLAFLRRSAAGRSFGLVLALPRTPKQVK